MKNGEAFAGRRGYWLRQLSDCAEPDFAALIQTLLTYGGSAPALYAKVYDGITPQGRIDPKTPILGLGDVLALQAQCYTAGVAFAPVVVPRARQGEIALHAQVAQACGCIVVDYEVGNGFVPAGNPGYPATYWSGLRQAAPDAWVVTQPDPRNLNDSGFWQNVGNYDGVAAQHYVGWAEVMWADVVAEVGRYDAILSTGLPCYPTLYGVGDAPTVSTFWRAVRDYSEGLQFFSLGPMGPRAFELARGCKLPGEPL